MGCNIWALSKFIISALQVGNNGTPTTYSRAWTEQKKNTDYGADGCSSNTPGPGGSDHAHRYSCHNNNITNKCTEENDLEGSRIWILPSSSFVFVDVYFVNCKPASLFPLDLTLQSFLLLLTRLDYNGLRGKARACLVAQHGERIGWQIDRKKETEKLWEMSNMTTMGVWEAPTTPYYKVWTSPRNGGPIPMCNWRRKIWPDVFFNCLCVQLSSLFVVGCTHWCARHFLMVCLYGSLLRCERMESPGAASQHAPMKIDGCSLIATLRIMPHWPLDRLLASLFQAKKDP